jgi:hypothetical protein
LDNNIKNNFIANDILFFEKQCDRYVLVDRQTEATSSFAVYTGFNNRMGERLYAQYYLRKTGWTGTFICTKQQILDTQFTYKIGSLLFDSFSSANQFINKLHSMLLIEILST